MMYKLLKKLFVLFCVVAFFSSCRKQAFEDYYGRPDNLQPPIYQVLTSKGNFTNLLSVIDMSGYKNTLSAAGYWTFFAPNDAAFQKYFADNNTTLAAIDSVTARKIVTYCLVFNAFQTNHIADFQSTAGYVVNNAYKRRTAYYDGFYTGQGPDGASTVLISANRNGTYLFGDNNNKYIPYFYSTYMAAKNLTAADYNYFFPTSTYTGFNVVNAAVVNKDILAENGVIHEIDRVISPLPNIEQQLAGNADYSEFKKLFDQFVITYLPNNDATARYGILTGKSSRVYVKQYAALLAYALGNENFLKVQDNDGQTDGYSMFAPNNATFNKYMTDVILEFYGTINNLPTSIIADLLNSHLFNTTVWPSKFATTTNFLGEPGRINANNNVTEKKFCSNGVFYGTNQVQQANVFSTVYARAYLDPAYSLMTRVLAGAKTTITNPGLKYTLIMIPDVTLRALGYDFNSGTNQFTYTVNGTASTAAVASAQIQRIVNLCVIPTPESEMDNLGGQGIIETSGTEYIRWNNNTIFAGGNYEKNVVLNVVNSRTYTNGKVYFVGSGSLEYPVATLASTILKNAGNVNAPYYDFYQYLINSTAYSTGSLEISGLTSGASYTVFIPTKAAIQQAVRDGILPGTVVGSVVTPTYNPPLVDDKAKVARFIQYHIINGVTIATDGKKSPNGGNFPTFLTNAAGDKLELIINNLPNNLRVTDNFGRVSNVVNANSNILGTRTLFHQIDNYLKYNF
ncbi:fasciclin domain-containing protein [Mucilaginibacter terrae]|uniref:fasciclin domain-containing protein n=1 Tax=Mucilaginibacter terrae TaxID=1955052 RepID=UPI00363DB970